PLAPSAVELSFYPEGGELVAGVPNRVYFQAATAAGRPVAVEGSLVTAQDRRRVLARAATLTDAEEPGLSQGLGVFTFTPRAGERYLFRIEAPTRPNRDYYLPAVKPSGVVLHLPQAVADGAITAELYSAGQDRSLLVGAYCRGRLLAQATVRAAAGQKTPVRLPLAAGAGGVCRVTVFEERGRAGYVPVAERLTYARAGRDLAVTARPDRADYAAGEAVRLHLEARDEKNEPVPALALVAVADRPRHGVERGLPAHFLLAT